MALDCGSLEQIAYWRSPERPPGELSRPEVRNALDLREFCGLDPVAFDAALDALQRHDVLTTNNGHYRYSVELMRRWALRSRDA